MNGKHPWGVLLLLLFKKHLRRPMTYVIAGLCVLLLAVLGRMVRGREGTQAYGMIGEAYAGGAEVISYLTEEDEIYTLREYHSREKLMADVRSGVLDCGFVLLPVLNEVTDLDQLAGTVEYYASTSTAKGFILREKVFAALLRPVSRQVLVHMSEDASVFAAPGEAVKEEILADYAWYLEGNEVLQATFEEMAEDGDVSPENSAKDRDTAYDLAGLMIFAAALLFGRNRFLQENLVMKKSLPGRERLCFDFLEILCPTLLTALAMAGVEGLRGGGLPAVLSLFGCALLSTLWSLVYSALFRREALYLPSLSGVLLLAVVTSDRILRLTALIPAAGLLKWLFPMHYML